MMLFLAFIFCGALAKRLCKREGIDGNLIPDLIIWLFVAGIAGGRMLAADRRSCPPRYPSSRAGRKRRGS